MSGGCKWNNNKSWGEQQEMEMENELERSTIALNRVATTVTLLNAPRLPRELYCVVLNRDECERTETERGHLGPVKIDMVRWNKNRDLE
jgi:hypothetical protein